MIKNYLKQEVDRENEEGMNTDLMVDVDEDLQNELCKLWDMSMNAVGWILSCINRKPISGVSDQVLQKQDCTTTEDGQRLQISN